MSEYDRGRSHKKKYISKDLPNNVGRNVINKYNKTNDEDEKVEIKIKQPTILLKTRDQEEISSPKKSSRENESTSNQTGASSNIEAHSLPELKYMHKAIKFLDEGMLFTDNLQDYVRDNSDFLVVGVIGQQGVGKSSILNGLANNKITKEVLHGLFSNKPKNRKDSLSSKFSKLDLDKERNEYEIFRKQNTDDIESVRNRTNGIDIFISDDRVIYLDCQPFSSLAIMDDLVENDNKRSNLVSELVQCENSGEIQALQITSFLMTVCHIFIVVQDWFFDSNTCRFIQASEMMKPTMTNSDDEVFEYFPHLLLVHNRATVDDFSPSKFKIMQNMYKSIFLKSRLILNSNLGISSGRLVKHLSPENCGPPLNIFLVPEYDENEGEIFRGHPPIEEIFKKMKANMFGVSKNPLTHVQLTEKTWLIYCSKVWENVRKSSFFVEYTKLMP
ncbi:protein SMG9 [Coccinella septempunctata]|uniref:protein SMG9 n=1 Tax=Coccinella septempunctata TaxID=41139 RepID=UPI001D067F7B|nr:protein SMG9 [Coccinella septempunctata]